LAPLSGPQAARPSVAPSAITSKDRMKTSRVGTFDRVSADVPSASKTPDNPNRRFDSGESAAN
jgi:hypothetical protein